jgi:hypothetical protein
VSAGIWARFALTLPPILVHWLLHWLLRIRLRR